MHVQDRQDRAATRVAVVASKRVGGAVQRNRAKRLLREAARLQAWNDGLDVVLVARAACAKADLARVDQELSHAVTSLGVGVAKRASLGPSTVAGSLR